jgi:hypothetical protein
MRFEPVNNPPEVYECTPDDFDSCLAFQCKGTSHGHAGKVARPGSYATNVMPSMPLAEIGEE